MKVGSTLIVNAPNGASEMALAVEIQLPEKALTRNDASLAGLIERAAAGESAAFEQIMIHSQQRVLTLSWRMLGNEADARDASQEVFLRVYKYLGRFRQDQDFFAWVYGITLNVCRDILKQRQRRSHQFISFPSEVEQDVVDAPIEQDDAEQLAILRQRRQLISKAIATLPYKERAAIVLRDVEGLSTDEVAQVLKSSSTTVRSQISSARQKIRDYCRRHLRLEQNYEL
jgi:RNA polymerase sigma-70 factor, ECF subfamily